mgnify:FL=1
MTSHEATVSRHAPVCRLFCVPTGTLHPETIKPRVGARVTKYKNRRTGGKKTQMLSEHQNKNANYLRILMTLRALRQRGDITEKEYRRAKKYYQNLTGADIVLTD